MNTPVSISTICHCAITWAFGLPVDHIGRLIALAIVKHCARDGTAYPSMARIAELSGIDRRTVSDRIARLIEVGAIEDTGRTVGRRVRVLRAIGYRPWVAVREGRAPARAPLAKPLPALSRPVHPRPATCGSGGRDLSTQHAQQLSPLNYEQSAHPPEHGPAVADPPAGDAAAPAVRRGMSDGARQRLAEARQRLAEAPLVAMRPASVSRPAKVGKTGLEGVRALRQSVPLARPLLACLPGAPGG